MSPGRTSASTTRRPLTHVPFDEPRSRSEPAARPRSAARRGGARRCRRRARAGTSSSGRSPAWARSRSAASRQAQPARARREARPQTRQRRVRRGRQVGGEAAQLVAARRCAAPRRRGGRRCRSRAGPRGTRGAAAATVSSRVSCDGRTVRAQPTTVRPGCESKLRAELHKPPRRATLPRNRLAASAVEEERGRSWGGSTERTQEPGSGERAGLKCFWRRGAMRVRSSHEENPNLLSI